MKQLPVAMLPVQQSERILLLDSLRGIAILGILLVNIRGFGLPYPAVSDPSVTDDTSGKNYYAWFINEWLFDGSFRSLLSMLFGAGMLLFLQRAMTRTTTFKSAELFYRKQFWLLVFGFINAYLLLWFWDILYMYAVCGMVLFAFRRFSANKFFIAAAICMLVTDVQENADLYRKKVIIHKGETILKSGVALNKLTAQQREELDEYSLFSEKSKLVSKQKAAEEIIHKTNGDLSGLYTFHSQKAWTMQTTNFFSFYFWDILLFMFIGMAFYKQGILTGETSSTFYWLLAVFGLGIGLLLSWLRLKPVIDNGFNEYAIIKKISIKFYETARCFRALGVFGVIMLLYKSGRISGLFRLLQPVGQMAFTNYLMQSILCGLFFYGIGFGLFGHLGRFELYYVVGVIWLLQIVFSHLWLKYYQYGPFEWAWRSLTYWKKQPFRKQKNSATLAS